MNEESHLMTDVVYVVLAIALFAMSAGYVGACEWLTRAEDKSTSDKTSGG
jgi:hypothetical protein